MTCEEFLAKSETPLINMSRGERATFIKHMLSCETCKEARMATTDRRFAGVSKDRIAAMQASAEQMLENDFTDPEFSSIVGPVWGNL